jgi:hypothetical protein
VSPAERKAGLEALLLAHAGLWRPQPFKEDTPAWCQAHPALAAEVLALSEHEVTRLNGDNAALIALVGRHIPALADLAALIDLPAAPGQGTPQPREEDGRFFRDIPGRKREQIEAYAAVLGRPAAPLLEWCAGKGHLGRLLAHRWQSEVHSLEIDPALCADGAVLARQAQLDARQHFLPADALAAASARHLHGRHGVALHACGDLHRALVTGAAEAASPALDLAPCCYYRTRDALYRPLAGGCLELNHDDLRLAVTDTATASALERQRARRAMAWKLGWVELRKAITGESGYTPFPPVPQAWLRGTFEDFTKRMRERAGLPPPQASPADGRGHSSLQPSPAGGGGQGGGSLAHFEARGYARAARVQRLELVRLAFRRPLEVWLVMDMACYLEERGYAVEVGTFCPAELTPRNLLLSARRTNL